MQATFPFPVNAARRYQTKENVKWRK